MSRAKRTWQLLAAACHQLQQWRGAKAAPVKLAVELLKDVEGVGAAGQLARVNHGYARNFLVPNRLAVALPKPRRGQQAAATAWSQGQQSAAARSRPADATLERQQQQFDKLIKTLTSTTLSVKRRTKDGQVLEQALQAQDIADAVAKQLRIRLVPEMVDMGGESLRVVGEYRLPLKLQLANGERATLDVSVAST